jgi:uncharacterized protein YdeI (BOF family)
MKNQKGFIVPLLITIILVLIVGFAIYVFNDKENISVPIENNSITTLATSSTQVQTQDTQAPTAVNDGDKVPSIYSINPTQTDHQNTIITIKGAYLNGFEGDTAVWFENDSGQSGVIIASSYTPAGAITLTFTLPNQLCTKNMGESGLPCPSYIDMRPGSYKVFAQPWSIKSNKLDFTIKQ